MRGRVKELNEATTLAEMIAIVDKYYDVNTPLKEISKKMVAAQIPNIVDMLRLKRRENA